MIDLDIIKSNAEAPTIAYTLHDTITNMDTQIKSHNETLEKYSEALEDLTTSIELENNKIENLCLYLAKYGDLKPHIFRASDKSCYVITWFYEGQIHLMSLGPKKYKISKKSTDTTLVVTRRNHVMVIGVKSGQKFTMR